MDVNIDLNILEIESAEQYHAKASEYLSSSMLKDFLKSPDYYRRKELGMVKEVESPSTLLGTAAHTRILEGKMAYESRFAFIGPINPQTGKPYGSTTKAWMQWTNAQGKPVLSESMMEQVEAIARGVSINEDAAALLLWGRSEGVARATYHGMPCQIRIDWLHPEHGIVDLKTTGRPIEGIAHQIREYRYHNQLAFYQAVLAEVIGARVPVHLVVVEANEPHRCQVIQLTTESLERAGRRNEAAIDQIRKCRCTDHWPSIHENVRILDVP
ncbi:MAG: PD-(D/E)XK nuclease-like domain-containing protein [Sedimentisphaerales bacterium]|nr:PD-(D/E)XK nuclease-like domain-containing protein [Sedimentisphaerales bacterium]